MGYVTVSAKIRRELYLKLKSYGVPISQVIRQALENEVRKREEEEIRRSLSSAQKILARIPPEEIAEVIRLSRDER